MRLAIPGMVAAALLVGSAEAQVPRPHLDTEDLPAFLRDRGEGIPTSMFGTYVQKGQLLAYPFAEHDRDSNYEYKPADLGYAQDQDFRGDYEAEEYLIFLGYGFSDRLALELEAAIISAELEKAPGDASGLPAEISESGLGDVEGQIRWRWNRETERRPEVFSYFETVMPTQNEGSLIGTTDWEFKLGTGVVRGYRWGTVTVRAAVEYALAEGVVDLGEYAVEYLKRLSSTWRVYGGLEGSQDEVSLITEAQWHLFPNAFLKVNSGFGLTSKATDWAPELGVMFSF
jgi:hypothetical protein